MARRYRAGVISAHATGSRPGFRDLLAFRLAGARRVVVTAHGLDVVQPRRRWTMRLRALLFSVMVVPSPSGRESAIAWGVPARKVVVIANGVPRMDPVERGAARASFGLAKDAFVVGCASRFEKRKHLDDLVEAVARVPGAHLLLAGNPGARDRVLGRGRELLGERMHFVGWLPEGVERLYAAADVFCLPSERESFGLVYLEAAQFGVPSIGCDTPGTRDTVEDGYTGLLVPVGDVEAISAAITRLRDDPELRARLGQAAREKACLLSEERMARRYAALFGQVAER